MLQPTNHLGGPPLDSVQQVHISPLLRTPELDTVIQLYVICKLAEGTLNPTVCVIDKDIKEHQSQDRALRDTIRHQPLRGYRVINHSSLSASIQPIPYPLNSPPLKSKFLKFGVNDATRDRIKSPTKVQVDDTAGLPLVEHYSPPQKGLKTAQDQFALSEAMLER
ncbi:testosterone 17-beta-dehydrogenase 3-like [Pitangus sulphuratus]|nr:testosterone 17-beta-dehydrogenase 3-like [Pitangus sulphuratus]